MNNLLALVLIPILLLTGCTAASPPLRPIAPGPQVARATPDWMDRNFFVPPRSATMPQFKTGEVLFHVRRGDCSRHADPGGISDCASRTTRAVISKHQVWEQLNDFKDGQRYLITFDFWIDPKFQNAPSSLRLSLARFYGSRYARNRLFEVRLDPKNGVTFMGHSCVPAASLGGWHRFSLRMRLASDPTGYVEARCDSRLQTGTPFLAKSDIITTWPLRCSLGQRCNIRNHPMPQQYHVELGIIADPVVANGRRQFAPLPADGLTVRMKRIVVKRLLVVGGRVENL